MSEVARAARYLVDIVLINLNTPPDDTAPGAVIQAGFTDEAWQPKAANNP